MQCEKLVRSLSNTKLGKVHINKIINEMCDKCVKECQIFQICIKENDEKRSFSMKTVKRCLFESYQRI